VLKDHKVVRVHKELREILVMSVLKDHKVVRVLKVDKVLRVI
jgi:hypothetical protein